MFQSKTRRRFWETVYKDKPLDVYTLHTIKCEVRYIKKFWPKQFPSAVVTTQMITKAENEIAFRILLEEQ